MWKARSNKCSKQLYKEPFKDDTDRYFFPVKCRWTLKMFEKKNQGNIRNAALKPDNFLKSSINAKKLVEKSDYQRLMELLLFLWPRWFDGCRS